MYYRVAIQRDSSVLWQWESTVLSSLDTVVQFLRLYRALPPDRLRVFFSSSRESLAEQLEQENQGLPSTSLTAAQFLSERMILPSTARSTAAREEATPRERGSVVVISQQAVNERDGEASALLLHSSKTITKETMQVTSRFGRPSPDPGFGSVIELRGGNLHRSFNLTGIRKALPSEGIATEQAPPALLEVEPTCTFGNKDVLEARMICEPGASFQAVMTAQIVGDDKDIPRGIVGFDVLEQFNVILGITRSRTARDLLAIADSQRSIDPRFVIPATLL